MGGSMTTSGSGNTRLRFISILSIIGGLLLWGLAARLVNSESMLPSPLSVWRTAVEISNSGLLWESIAISLQRTGIGYAIGVLLGIVTGLLLGGLGRVAALFGPIFEFLKGVAPISLVPIMILWFGIGELPKVLIIAYITWVVVTVNTASGVQEIPAVRLRSARCLGLSEFEVFYRVILPSAAHYIMVGMRSGIGFAYIALVSAEFIAVDKGVGYLIMDSRFAMQTSLMVVGIMTLGLLGSGSQWLFDVITRRLPGLARFLRA
jgi:ABC-type nitrate/sulfonate/bicarbonate transport system permease component